MERWSGVDRCARIWRDVVTIALADLEHVPHLQVRYEDLVRAPDESLAAIVGYLDLSPGEEMPEFARNLSDRVRGSYEAARQTVWSRDDHERRVGRFRENLTSEEQRRLTVLLGPLLDRLGYRRAPSSAD